MKPRPHVILLSLILLSCSDQQKFTPYHQAENSKEYSESIEFIAIDTLSFYLDSRSSYETNSISYSSHDGNETLSYLSAFDSEIHVFNFSNQTKIKTIKIDFEGPNGVGMFDRMSCHYLLSFDSIFLYNLNIGQLFLLDSNAKKLNQYTVSNYSDTTIPTPIPWTLRPMQFADEKIYFPCGPNGYKESYEGHPSSLVVDLSTKKASYLTTFIPSYSQAFWGDGYKYDPGIALNIHTNQIVVNYPIDHHLQVMDLKDKSTSLHYVGSSHIEEIEPYQSNVRFFEEQNSSVKDHIQSIHGYSNSDYESILYDRFLKVYYRIAYLRPSRDRVELGEQIPDFSIIILNEQFEKIGERVFEKELYDSRKIVVTSKGLIIGRKDFYEKDEDFMVFEVFRPSSIKNLETDQISSVD